MRNSLRRERRALTWLEVVVVLFCIGILASLILPGINSQGRRGRRSQCMNNVRQIGLALLQYAAENNTFPASGVWDVPDANANGMIDGADLVAESGWRFNAPQHVSASGAEDLQFGMRYGWPLLVLPYLEHCDVYDMWDFSEKTGGGSYLASDAGRPSLDNRRISAMTSLKILNCPEDITTIADQGNLSYVVNGGLTFHWLVNQSGEGLIGEGEEPDVQKRLQDNRFAMGLMFLEPSNGARSVRRRHSLATIKDGVSTTVMLSENVNTGVGGDVPWPTNWACPHPYNTSFFLNGAALANDANQSPRGLYDYKRANTRGAKAPPADPAGFEGGINGDLSGLLEGRFPYPSSFHTGGVHIVMCDGSTKFLSDTVDPVIWARLVSPAGETLANPADGAEQRQFPDVFSEEMIP